MIGTVIEMSLEHNKNARPFENGLSRVRPFANGVNFILPLTVVYCAADLRGAAAQLSIIQACLYASMSFTADLRSMVDFPHHMDALRHRITDRYGKC